MYHGVIYFCVSIHPFSVTYQGLAGAQEIPTPPSTQPPRSQAS